MRRRTFIAGLGSAAAWPVAARAQQGAFPIVGFLSPATLTSINARASFGKGLSETGFIEGQNVAIEYRFANNAGAERLKELAADLVRRRVTVIAATGLGAALAAKAATATIPIVFRTGNDPVRYGLVASFNRPGGNVTGINDIGRDLAAKRLGLLHELLPGASRFAALVERNLLTESTLAELAMAALAIGGSIEVVTASTSSEIDTAYASLVQKRIDALWVSTDSLFANRSVQLVMLATYHRLPAIYPGRLYTESGGLISYGTDFLDSLRQVGVYTGNILKGAKPADLPVARSTRFELGHQPQNSKPPKPSASPYRKRCWPPPTR
jgi:putative tryptophan/tyrosine transport system substrate-binding protein